MERKIKGLRGGKIGERQRQRVDGGKEGGTYRKGGEGIKGDEGEEWRGITDDGGDGA